MNSPVLAALRFARAEELAVALDAPRSWSKEAKLAFTRLPADLQQFYAARDRDREREIRRAQNERAEALRKLAAAEARIAELEKEATNVRAAGKDPVATETGTENV
jgi:chromosome segregation ATPase